MLTMKCSNNILLLLFTIVLCTSCSKREDKTLTLAVQEHPASFDLPSAKNGRLVFPDYTAFKDAVHLLSQKSMEDVDNLLKNNSFHSLYDTLRSLAGNGKLPPEQEALDTLHLPYFITALLNTKGEVLIGDSISWFKNGKEYFIHKNEEAALPALKVHAGFHVRSVPAYASKLPHLAAAKQLFLDKEDPDGKWQHEFVAQYPNRGNRKYVVEMAPVSLDNDRYLVLRCKLEWKGSGNWKPAGEEKVIKGSIEGSAVYLMSGWTGTYTNGPDFSFAFFAQQSNNFERSLGAFRITGGFAVYSFWEFEMTGYITEHIVGDIPENEWTFSGDSSNPLW